MKKEKEQTYLSLDMKYVSPVISLVILLVFKGYIFFTLYVLSVLALFFLKKGKQVYFIITICSAFIIAFFDLVIGLCAIFYIEGVASFYISSISLFLASVQAFRFIYYRKHKEFFIVKKERKNSLMDMLKSASHNYECLLCGAELEKDARFCKFCGVDLEEKR